MKTIIILSLILLRFSLQTFSQTPGWAWAKHIGGTGNDQPYHMVIDGSGAIYTCGSFNGPAVDFDPGPGVFNLTTPRGFLSKLDSSGNFLWAKSWGPVVDARSLAFTATGEIYVTGYFGSVVDFDPDTGIVNVTANGVNNMFVSKFDSVGHLIWVRTM